MYQWSTQTHHDCNEYNWIAAKTQAQINDVNHRCVEDGCCMLRYGQCTINPWYHIKVMNWNDCIHTVGRYSPIESLFVRALFGRRLVGGSCCLKCFVCSSVCWANFSWANFFGGDFFVERTLLEPIWESELLVGRTLFERTFVGERVWQSAFSFY